MRYRAACKNGLKKPFLSFYDDLFCETVIIFICDPKQVDSIAER